MNNRIKQFVYYILPALFLPPVFVSAQDAGYLTNIVNEVSAIINIAVPVLVAVALAFFLWGLVVFMTRAGGDQEEGKKHMVWGVIILFIAVSVWGFVEILQTMFGADGDVGTIEPPALPEGVGGA